MKYLFRLFLTLLTLCSHSNLFSTHGHLYSRKVRLRLYKIRRQYFVTFRDRADFLCHMKPSDVKSNNSHSGPTSANWTLVDEGGEEVSSSRSNIL